MAERKLRNSNFELLRIISMILIVLAHYGGHGGLIDNAETTSGHILGLFFKTGGKLGVVCFVLISTYFLCEQKFKFEALLKTILQTFFYAFLIIGILFFAGESIGFGAFIKSGLAIVYSLYWFATAYTAMYLFQPLLKKCTDSLDENKSRSVVIVMFIVLSLIPFFAGGTAYIVNTFVYFCFLFFVGSHIKKYNFKTQILKKHPLGLCIISALLIPTLSYVIEIVLNKIHILEKVGDRKYILYELNSPLMLFAGLGLFLTFKNLKPRSNKIINKFAANMFGVYLLHDNGYFRNFLWHKLFRIDSVYGKNIFIIIAHAMLCVFIIMICAAIIEFIRKYLEKFIFNTKLVNKICIKFNNWYGNI